MKMRAIALTTAFMVGSVSATQGVVIESGTDKPLADVTLAVRVIDRGFVNPTEARIRCVGLEVVTSDTNGSFNTKTSLAIRPIYGTALVIAYKPGYRLYGIDAHGQTIILERAAADPAERFDQLTNVDIPTDCPHQALMPLVSSVLMPLYSEVSPLVRTARQWDQADGILRTIEMLKFGASVADRNADLRAQQRPQDVRNDGGVNVTGRAVRP